jgi:hypothetical protein
MLLLKLVLLFHYFYFFLDNGNRQYCNAFAPPSLSQSTTASVVSASQLRYYQSRQLFTPPQRSRSAIIIPTTSSKFTTATTTTRLYNGVIIDVPDNFFTSAFFTIGLTYSLGKAYNRYLLEEIAFERRKMEAREEILQSQRAAEGEQVDVLTTELEMRRMESAQWLSIYGRKFRGRGETTVAAAGDSGGVEDGSTRRRRNVRQTKVLERNDDDDDEDEEENTTYRMSDAEIQNFESAYNIPYDPYYDEPYTEDELPIGKYKIDKSYGDRRYENGEIFYKDERENVFYRQGSRPRQKKFWDWNS